MIKSLLIKNVKKITEFNSELGNLNIISGSKQKGKSTIVNSIYFLLGNQVMTDNSSNYNDIESLLPYGNHDAVASVEITLDDNTKLRKDYLEVWSKTRGTSDYVFKGRVQNRYINDVEVGEAEFNQAVLKSFNYNPTFTANDKSFNYISFAIDPLYLFYKTDWKIARNVIESVVGKVTDEDILKSNTKYSIIVDDVKTYSPMKKMDKARLNHNNKAKELSQRLKQLEAVSKELGGSYDKPKFDETANRLKELQSKYYSLKSVGVSELTQELQDETNVLNSRYLESYNCDLRNNVNTQLTIAQDELVETRQRYENLVTKYNAKYRQRERLYNEALNAKTTKDNYKSKATTVELELAKEFEKVLNVDTCPHCGGILTSEEAINDYETAKAIRVNQYKTDIEKLKKLADEESAKIAEKKKLIINLDAELKEDYLELNLAKDELKQKENSFNEIKALPFNPITNETVELKKQYEAKAIELAELRKTANEKLNVELKKIQLDIDSVQTELEPLNRAMYNHKRKVEVEHEISDLISNINLEEQKAILCDEFIKDQARSINQNAKDKLGIEFCMLQSQVNGGLTECCYPLLNGIPYSRLSTSEKIEIGYKCIKAIKELDNSKDTLPIIFDRAEAFGDKSELAQFNEQVICSWTDGSGEIKLEVK